MLLRLAGYHIYYFKQNKGKIPTITYDRLPNSKCSSITTRCQQQHYTATDVTQQYLQYHSRSLM